MYVIRNATLHTATDRGTVEGDLSIQDGKIVAVGDVDAPPEATEIDVDGAPVTPGLVDAHSHAGMAEWGEPEDGDINEGTDPVTPHVNALDGFHPRDEELKYAFQNGVTTVSARMGSGNVVGGVICSMKTYGDVADRMLVREDGMKAAMGENPKRFHGEQKDRQPATRPGVAATLRQALMDAEDYVAKREKAVEDGEPFDRDLGLENLARVVEGDLPLRVHAHRADDIMTVFRIAEEFGIDNISIEHATEGHLIAEEFVERDIPAVCGPSLYSGAKYELRNITFETPGILHEAGVNVAIQTDAPVLPQRHLDVCVGLAVREGLPEAAALDVVTRNPAEILGIEDRVGTLAEGTDADIVVWDGPFYQFDTSAQHVFVDGEHVFDRAEDAVDPREEWQW
ncbi:amidohydrolase [Halogeometricum borinquense DSM 11551]|uniref:Amidohydrolase n=1 Tax=Halogeometricum borinquense (strain ATCC 700274 / DSM 11551 / JCM 10706 / KCTC 4070 / PR3) TaxID=469382 RepID=E4NVN3_HALBP|nr:amidohydrolase family protein [Halogeometricum borinquense]ADQ68917.1 amidohydrolase, imidazolonepropionase [Halogeometricum borinquense DSM 11551]ELY28953.1 amidohydrolase [Halogeometricum borinquense DSM 11551]